MSNGDQHKDTSKYTETSEFALWEKYESIAMHFNELLIRLRTQALGGLTGIVALSGLAANFAKNPESKTQWMILGGTLGFFALAWVALFFLDIFYYDRLLRAAVDAIIAHEGRTSVCAGSTDKTINLSTKIRARVGRYRWVIIAFYLLVLVGLGVGIFYTFTQAYSC